MRGGVLSTSQKKGINPAVGKEAEIAGFSFWVVSTHSKHGTAAGMKYMETGIKGCSALTGVNSDCCPERPSSPHHCLGSKEIRGP